MFPTARIFPQSPVVRQDRALMPGDPLRSKFIAGNFLENPVLVNNVRACRGYTGTYKGVKGLRHGLRHGYARHRHLFPWVCNGYGVENIIRVGSAGAIRENIHLYDLVIAQGACTDSTLPRVRHLQHRPMAIMGR